MSRYQVEIHVKPRPGLLDPQGKAIHHALKSLGFSEVADVRMGKAIYLDMEAASADAAREAGETMCRKLLANPVTEDFDLQVRSLNGDGS